MFFYLRMNFFAISVRKMLFEVTHINCASVTIFFALFYENMYGKKVFRRRNYLTLAGSSIPCVHEYLANLILCRIFLNAVSVLSSIPPHHTRPFFALEHSTLHWVQARHSSCLLCASYFSGGAKDHGANYCNSNTHQYIQ